MDVEYVSLGTQALGIAHIHNSYEIRRIQCGILSGGARVEWEIGIYVAIPTRQMGHESTEGWTPSRDIA